MNNNLFLLMLCFFPFNYAIAQPIAVVEDGIPIHERGVFYDGCYYGKDESLSDHGPVFYGDFGTWNVGSPISHYKIIVDKEKPATYFFNHKFFTDEEGNLIDREKKRIGFLGSSEVVLLNKIITNEEIKKRLSNNREKETALLKKQLDAAVKKIQATINDDDDDAKEKLTQLETSLSLAQKELDDFNEVKYTHTIDLLKNNTKGYYLITNSYIERITEVINKIKEFFKKNSDLNYMVIEEIPASFEKTMGNETIHSLLKDLIETASENTPSNLTIQFYSPLSEHLKTNIAKTNFKKNLNPDLALISRKTAPVLTQVLGDKDNRFVAWCSNETKACFTGVHMPYPTSDEELMIRCKDMQNIAAKLIIKGYKTISMAGDFNTHASRIAKTCEAILPLPHAEVTLHTLSQEENNSCGSNNGEQTSPNIDIKLSYKVKDGVQL